MQTPQVSLSNLLCCFFYFLLLSWSVNCLVVCDTVKLSYELCNTDPVCRYSFSIDQNQDDLAVFSFQLSLLIKEAFVSNETLVEMFCGLKEETEEHFSTEANSLAMSLWLSMMRAYSYCEESNEYFDIDIGCSCRENKLCTHETAQEHVPNITQHNLLAFFIGFALLFLFLWYPPQVSNLYKKIEDLNAELKTLTEGTKYTTTQGGIGALANNYSFSSPSHVQLGVEVDVEDRQETGDSGETIPMVIHGIPRYDHSHASH